jgi:hypothetical protein
MPVVYETTTNNSFAFPTSANNGSDFSTGLDTFADGVDAMWASGTYAVRPATPPSNSFYYATDVKLLYQYAAIGWQTVMLAGTWTPITSFGTGIIAASVPPAARVVGDTVVLSGGIAVGASAGNGDTLFTLPSSAMQPNHLRPINGIGSASGPTLTACQLLVASSSTIVTNGGATIATGTNVFFEGMSYRLV